MTSQSYSDGTYVGILDALYHSIVHIRATPAIDSSPTTPKFSGNWVTANSQTEKTTQITASHISKILFDSLIVHLLTLLFALDRKRL